MKKLNFWITLVIIASLALSSCKKDKDEAGNGEFSKLTVEENKVKVEDEGFKFIKHMTDLKDCKSGDVAATAVALMENSTPFDNNPAFAKAKPLAVLYYLKAMKENKLSAIDAAKTLKSGQEDPETMEEAWADLVGTYEWNATTQEWVSNPGGNSMVMKFPSTETGTQNNVVYTLHPYTGTSNHTLDYTGELPISIKTDMTVDGVKEMELTLTATYDKDGVPTNVSVVWFLNPFTISTTNTNTSSKVSSSFAIKKAGETVLDFALSAEGNFTKETLQGDEEGDVMLDDVVTKIDANLQIENLKLTGSANAKTIISGINDIEDKNLSEAESTKQVVALLNENYNVALMYASDNTKIADTEFYTLGTNNAEADIRLVFGDGTKSDISTYLEKGFSDFEKELNDFLTSINDEYGTEIDYIEVGD